MNDATPPAQLSLTHEAVAHVEVIRKWSMFIAIIGFLVSGFVVLFGLFFALLMKFVNESAAFGFIPSAALSLLYIGIGVVYFFPSYFLMRFSVKARLAVLTNDSFILTTAFKYLKSHYVFLGVAVIAGMVLYVFVMIGIVIIAMIGGLSGKL